MSTATDTSRYGKAYTDARERAHQQVHRRAGWAGHRGQPPTVDGTLIRLVVDRLPESRNPKIASAVEEQTATTNEMSRSIPQAATGSGEIAASITAVATDTGHT